MDPSTQAAQDVQNQTQQPAPTTQPASLSDIAQNGLPTQNPPQHKTQVSISGGGIEAESGGAMIVQEDPDADNEEEEAIKVAPQEKKTQVVMGMGADEQDEDQQSVSQAPIVDVQEVEVQPAVPEVAVSSPEVEKVVEVTPPEAPKITEELKDLGVTHSGPGIIDVSQIQFKPKPIPVTYEQALTEEEKIKQNRVHSSRFWLLEHIKYLWRKINPNIEATVVKPAAQKTVVIKQNPISNQVVPAQSVKIAQANKEVNNATT